MSTFVAIEYEDPHKAQKATPDKVFDEIKQYGGTVLQTCLSHDDEAKLQSALDEVKQAAS